MPFGLTNAPAAFQNLINDTFCPFLDSLIVLYLDDILVYSCMQEEHDQHIRQVLETMRTAKLYAKAEKCTFEESSTEYLGFIVDVDGVRMDPKKIEVVQSWPQPTNIREVQSFLGFCNFYRHFIRNYSTIAAMLTCLTRRDRANADFILEEKEITAFQTLRDAFHDGQIIRHFQPGLPIELEIDASDYALGSVLSQRHAYGKLYPIAFRSRRFDKAKLNYKVHNKELLAIVDACRIFRPYLEYVSVPTKVFSDHANLRYFFTSGVLNHRQAHWYETVTVKAKLTHYPDAPTTPMEPKPARESPSRSSPPHESPLLPSHSPPNSTPLFPTSPSCKTKTTTSAKSFKTGASTRTPKTTMPGGSSTNRSDPPTTSRVLDTSASKRPSNASAAR
ncbi:hypothetical protein JCM1840_007633 [Sporobolomyces johnsonii]